MRVWDPLVRVAHWTLGASVLGCLVWRHGGALHETLGWVALVTVMLRVVWGFSGPRHARFADFVHRPRHVLAYARAALRGREPRHIGHNPLGGWMIVALLLVGGVAGLSGALSVTDRYWGVAWVGTLHEVSAWSFAVLVPLHVAGVVVTSLRQRENLAAAMITGRKRSAAEGDVA